MRINLPEIFLRSFENVGPGLGLEAQVLSPDFDMLRPPWHYRLVLHTARRRSSIFLPISSDVVLDLRHSDAQGWASECPDVKNYK